MQVSGVTPNGHSFGAVINACAKAGDVSAACRWLQAMRKAGIGNVVAYGAVLDACAKAGDVIQAEHVFQQMRNAGVKPNLVSYTSLAQTYAHKGMWQEVEALATQLLQEGLVMNEHFLYVLLLAYAGAQRSSTCFLNAARPTVSDRAAAAFADAAGSGVPVNHHVASALQRAVGRHRAQELLEENCSQAVSRRLTTAKT